jgi:alpha-L-fucosidase
VKTPYDLIEMAVKANSLDGNFVINFGPDGKGNIRQEETDVAKGIGEWLAVNGDAIYGTHHSLLEKQDWGYSTQKDSTIYLTVFNKPMNNLLRVKLPKSKDRNMNFVISMTKFLFSNQPAPINGGGKAGTYYRDKNGYSYYDLIIPEEIQKTNQPFVIVIQLKEMDKKDQEAYQQAII